MIGKLLLIYLNLNFSRRFPEENPYLLCCPRSSSVVTTRGLKPTTALDSSWFYASDAYLFVGLQWVCSEKLDLQKWVFFREPPRANKPYLFVCHYYNSLTIARAEIPPL